MDVALALDVGGTKVDSALVDATGSVQAQSRSRRPTGREITEPELASAVRGLLDQALEHVGAHRLLGVGIASAGPISLAPGEISPLNLPRIRGFSVVEVVQRHLKCRNRNVPVTLRGDGAAVVLAERWVGAGQDTDNLMSIVISTGIGAGVISGGRLLSGQSGNAAHLGAVEVHGWTGEATYGAPGTVEAVASGPHTVAWARSQGWSGSDGPALARAYAANEPVAVEAVRRSAQAIGHAIASAAAMLDLDLVTIGGGFSNVTPDLVRLIREPIAQHYFPFVRALRIERSALSADGPLIGSAALIHRAEMLAELPNQS